MRALIGLVLAKALDKVELAPEAWEVTLLRGSRAERLIRVANMVGEMLRSRADQRTMGIGMAKAVRNWEDVGGGRFESGFRYGSAPRGVGVVAGATI